MDHKRLALLNRNNARTAPTTEWARRYNALADYHEALHNETADTTEAGHTIETDRQGLAVVGS